MSEWRDEYVGGLVSFEYGSALGAESRTGSGFPVYGSNGVVGSHGTALVAGPGIVIGRKGSAGALQWSEGDFWPIDTTYWVKPRVELDLRWIREALGLAGLESVVSSTGVPGLNRGDAYERSIPVPPLEEQRRIAEILDTIDESIQATERVIGKLSMLQEGLVQRLLPEGGPVHQTASRELPEGWRFVTLDEIAVNHDGRRVPIRAEDRLVRRGRYPYYGASGVIDHIDDYLFDGTYVLLGEDGENVLSRSTPLAFIATGRIWVNNHAHVFEARAGVDPLFLARVLERTDYGGIAIGSAQPKITKLGLRQMRFPMPRCKEQAKLCDHLDLVENCISREIRHAAGLGTVRAGLAADLLSGRVRTVAA